MNAFAVDSKPLKIFAVIPGPEDQPWSVPFVRQQLDLLEQMGICVFRFFLASRTSPRVLIREIERFRRELRAFKPDLVHAHYGTVTSTFCALFTLLPLVITFRGSDLNPEPGEGVLRNLTGRLLSQFSALRANRIICVSTKLRNSLWCGRNHAVIIPSGVNLNRFRPIPREEARRWVRWLDEERVVLFNASDNPVNKGLNLAEQAIKYVKSEVPEVRLHVLDGHALPEMMPHYYCASDCLLMSSYYEGSPNVLKEALACNLPVVSVDVGDASECLNGVTQSCITDRTPEALGAAIVKIVKEKIRSNGRDIVQALSEELTARKVLEVYRFVAGKG